MLNCTLPRWHNTLSAAAIHFATQIYRTMLFLGYKPQKGDEFKCLVDGKSIFVSKQYTVKSIFQTKSCTSAKQSRLDVRKFSFSHRTVNVWNKLSIECVHASSVNMFNNIIYKYLVKVGYSCNKGRSHLE